MNRKSANQMGNRKNPEPAPPRARPVHYLPVLLDLRGKRCLVVGHADAADAKADELATAGAIISRRSDPPDPLELAGYFFCVAAGLSLAQNEAMSKAARQSGVLFYAVDDPEHSHLILPAVHRQGGLVIAVSTSGACPALAVRIRNRLAAQFGPEYAQFVAACAQIRSRLADLIPDLGMRRAAWYALVDSDLLDRIRSGEAVTAADLLEEACRNVGIAVAS